jgi:hypothetical protein
MTAHDPKLSALFKIADRETTAHLLKIATAIASGATAIAVEPEASELLRSALPDVADSDLDGVALFLSWAMYLQHVTTIAAAKPAKSPARKKKTAAAARGDIGQTSSGEVARLEAQIEELQNKNRQYEIKIAGLTSTRPSSTESRGSAEP